MRLKDWVNRQPDQTVAAIAERFGIQRVALHRAMSGQTMPRPDTCQRIEDATLGAVTAADLHAAHIEFQRTHPARG